MVIDDKTKQSTQEILFDFIAKSVADFMKEQNITTKLPLGFTFSFPVDQKSLISGTLIRWTKDFSATGAVGKDVVQLLRQAFIRQGVSPSVTGGLPVLLQGTGLREGSISCSISRVWMLMWSL